MSRNLLVEIGTEEIPSAPLYRAVEQLEKRVPEMLSEARLAHGDILVSATPRRLAIIVLDVADEQPDLEQTVKGPPARAAFDDNGAPTKAATGFAAKHGLEVDDLERRDEGGQEYVYAVVSEQGRPTPAVLLEMLPKLVSGIEWPKSMRWGSGDSRFSRPVRWLVCLYGHDVVPFKFAGLVADRVSQGHRFLSEGPVEIPVATEYGRAMGRVKVAVDLQERTELVRNGIIAAAGRSDAQPVIADKTFREVVNLVEWPSVAVGTFDESFLRVPREVLVTAMESHQRYFPVETEEAELLPQFVVVHNGAPELTERIVAGHERVIRARLADAAFFFDEDTKRPLEEYVQRLETIVFQEKLGTVAARVHRIEALTRALAQQVDAGPDESAWAARAAHLCKADLVTNMVVEFPSLQGVMGRHYAIASDEAPQVADAIVEHYMPRFAGDELPPTMAGKLVSLADKLDTMVGIFGAGMPPTGSADPYALRRGALGILNIIIDAGLTLRLDEAIGAALSGFTEVLPDLDPEAVGRDVKSFILGRMETVLKDHGHAYDTIEAVLEVTADDPADAARRALALTAFRSDEACEDLSTAYSRAKNLADASLGVDVDESLMGEPERALSQALSDTETDAATLMSKGDYEGALRVLSALRGPIDAFFENVLVMDDEETLRDNRLRLLNRFVAPFAGFADFSRLAD